MTMSGLLPLLPFLFVVLILGLVIFLTVYARRKEKERTQQLQLTASQLGWSFAASAPLNMIAGLERFALFEQGHGKEIKNFMYGAASGTKAAVFDYIYVIGYGKNRQTHRQSVVYLEPQNFSVPYFSLRPENL